MKVHSLFLISIVYSGTVFAQHPEMQIKPVAEKPATIVVGMSSHHHPVSTTKPEAQKFFDQVKQQFEAAWKNADTKLNLDLL